MDGRLSPTSADASVAEAFRQCDAPRISVRTVAAAAMPVIEIVNNRDGFGETDPIPYADATMLAVQLTPIPFHEAMTENRPVPVRDLRRGDTLFYDMRRDPRANVLTPSHSVHFILSRELLVDIAEATESVPIDEMSPSTGDVIRDRHLARFARMVLPWLRRPEQSSVLFASHLTFALGAYVCKRYGGMQTRTPPAGRLTSLERRLATEYIAAHLSGGIELSDIASLCGMPARRFADSFYETMGVAPYQWLSVQRLDLAKSLLRKRRSLREVAALCGFADQSHLVEVFFRATGATPFKWLQQLQ